MPFASVSTISMRTPFACAALRASGRPSGGSRITFALVSSRKNWNSSSLYPGLSGAEVPAIDEARNETTQARPFGIAMPMRSPRWTPAAARDSASAVTLLPQRGVT